MKKIFTIISIICFVSALSLQGQTPVKLKIFHKQGSQNFALNQESQNNQGNSHKFKRFQYYLSSFSIVHDGGIETPIDSLWALVNANENTEIELGEFNITTIEKIKFGVGIEQSFNHIDPSLFPVSHPLGPKSPSMHWGWSAGYRFAAVEGYGGSSLNNLFEFHALGDNNYLVATIDAPTIEDAGTSLNILLDADYDQVLNEINVSSGKIVHGSTGDAVKILQNFNTLVFSPSTNTSGVKEFLNSSFSFYPNPSTGQIFFSSISQNQFPLSVIVRDITGKDVLTANINSLNTPIDIDVNGLYFIQVTDNLGNNSIEKLVIK